MNGNITAYLLIKFQRFSFFKFSFFGGYVIFSDRIQFYFQNVFDFLYYFMSDVIISFKVVVFIVVFVCEIGQAEYRFICYIRDNNVRKDNFLYINLLLV